MQAIGMSFIALAGCKPSYWWHYFLLECCMKTQTLILTLGILACNNSAGNKQPDNDSTANIIQDTPAQPPAGDTTRMKDTTTLAGTWFLQPVLISDTATGKIPRLQFNLSDRRFTGHTGCNNMSGTFNYTVSPTGGCGSASATGTTGSEVPVALAAAAA